MVFVLKKPSIGTFKLSYTFIFKYKIVSHFRSIFASYVSFLTAKA